MPWALTLAAEALLRQARPDESEALVKQALKRAQIHKEFHWLSEIYRLDGCIQVARGATEPAMRCFEKARKIAADQGAWALNLRACVGRYNRKTLSFSIAQC